jgi:hypothetical protein
MIDPYLVSILTIWILFSIYFPINDWDCNEEEEFYEPLTPLEVRPRPKIIPVLNLNEIKTDN